MEKKESYNIDEIVWTKLKGCPWWPAKIIKKTKSRYKVLFIGENTHSFFNEKQMKPFKANLKKFSEAMYKAPDWVIKCADNICEGKADFYGIFNSF